MRREVEDRAADDEEEEDGDAARTRLHLQDAARHHAEVVERFRFLLARRDLPEDEEVDDVAGGEREGVPQREGTFPPDEGEVEDREEKAEDLDGVLLIELYGDEAAVALPAERRRDEVDHRPAEADQEAQAAGEV